MRHIPGGGPRGPAGKKKTKKLKKITGTEVPYP
jgi:hypothetical protein